MPYTYDYTSAEAGDESASRRYWRFAKMTLTRWTRAKTFVFNGHTYPYLYHFCNKTWKNERGVEIRRNRDSEMTPGVPHGSRGRGISPHGRGARAAGFPTRR